MEDWQKDKLESDKGNPLIKRAIEEYVGREHISASIGTSDWYICEAPPREDQHHNTDLVICGKNVMKRIGCRIRKYADKRYRDELTIRFSRPSGKKTEEAKMREGWGHLFFYAFWDYGRTDFLQWVLIDLRKFNAWYTQCIKRGDTRWTVQHNRDGSSDFLAFKLRDLSGCVVASYGVPEYIWGGIVPEGVVAGKKKELNDKDIFGES